MNIKRKLAAAARVLTPPIVWNAYLRARGLPQNRPDQQFDGMSTVSDTAPLRTGRFAAIHEKYYRINPFQGPDTYRYRHYNICWFANLCRYVPGDFVCAGVSFGATAKVLYEFLDFSTLGKTLHLIDPFEGTATAAADARVAANYNTDPQYVRDQFPPDAPFKLHRQAVPPLLVSGPLAFVLSDTGDPDSDVASLPDFYEALNPGGAWIGHGYGRDTTLYRPVFDRLGVEPLWLPSGQGVIIKQPIRG